MYFQIINHFAPSGVGPVLEASTVFSASLAARSPLVTTVLVVDGSGQENFALAKALKAVGADYCHAGKSLSFSEGYNYGLERSDQPWTVLCASDIYPPTEIYEEMLKASCNGTDQSVGCIVPLLSISDLPLQSFCGLIPNASLDIPLMTLNFNAFPTEYLRHIGGVPAEFSGAFNDVLLAYRIKQDSRRIVLLPVQCLHYGRLTLSAGKTRVDIDADFNKFADFYPELCQDGGYWGLDLRKFSNNSLLKFMGWLIACVPVNLRHSLAILSMWIYLRLASRRV